MRVLEMHEADFFLKMKVCAAFEILDSYKLRAQAQ